METQTGDPNLAGGEQDLRERALRQLKRKREFREHQIEREMARLRNR